MFNLELMTQIFQLVLSCTVSIYMIFHFAGTVFHKRLYPPYIYPAAFVLSTVLFILSNIQRIMWLNVLVSLFIIMFVCVILYGARQSSEIYIAGLFALFLFMAEFISSIVLSLIPGNIFHISAGDLLLDLVVFSLYQLFILLLKKPAYKVFTGQYLILLIVPAASIAEIYLLLHFATRTEKGQVLLLWMTWICLLILAINFAVYLIFIKMARLYERSQRYLLLNQQRQMQLRHYQQLVEKYESSQRLFHDIRNHVNTLQSLYENGNNYANEYADSLLKRMDQADTYYDNSHKLLSVLVNEWILSARQSGIHFDYQIEENDLSFMEDIDLVTLLTNLMDNAFDACLESSAKNVSLQILHINHFIIIQVTNTYLTSPRFSDGQYMSTKPGHSGLGIMNIKEVVNKYNGMLSMSPDGNTWTAQITFSGCNYAS